MLEFIKARLSEKSTWTAILGLLVTGLGWAIVPEEVDKIATGAVAVVSVVLAYIKTKQTPVA